jgi:hypothetical protein
MGDRSYANGPPRARKGRRTIPFRNAILFATAALCVPALVALSFIKPDEIDYCRARNAVPGEGAKPQTVRTLVGKLVCGGLPHAG